MRPYLSETLTVKAAVEVPFYDFMSVHTMVGRSF